jgi:hypothetical protein
MAKVSTSSGKRSSGSSVSALSAMVRRRCFIRHHLARVSIIMTYRMR